ncbi:MAG: glycosyltransferase [Bdellovibrionota bacterium]
MSDKQIDISIIIIALNEEENLKRCLQSLPEGCEIIVVDSGSKDKTVEVAASYGAIVKYRLFDNYANQKNFALSCATRGWIFH